VAKFARAVCVVGEEEHVYGNQKIPYGIFYDLADELSSSGIGPTISTSTFISQ
jgi:hypothetical protein